MTSEISAAVREQTNGLTDVNKAIGLFDTNTQANAQLAAQAATHSSTLLGEFEGMEELLSNLEGMLDKKTEDQNQKHKKHVASQQQKNNIVELPMKEPRLQRPQKMAVGGENFPLASDSRFED